MIVTYQCHNGRLELTFTPEKDDPAAQHIFNSVFKTTRQVEMGSNRCEIHLPADWTIESVHPDAFALALLAIIYPFSGSRMCLPRGVSRSFHTAVKQTAHIQVLPVDDQLPPRK